MNRARSITKSSEFRYLISGGSAFVMEYVAFLVLFYMLRLPVEVANAISFTFGLGVSFILNKFYTFKATSQARKSSHQLLIYILIALINLIISTYVIHLLVEIGLAGYVAKFGVIAMIAIWNFILMKKIIFK